MTDTVQIRVVNKSGFELPQYKTSLSAGMDLKAVLEEPAQLTPGERGLIKTGLFIELPAGYEAQVRPRSGMALKQGVTVLNSPGTIDADYRGEIGVILINHSSETVVIEHGDRIAQLVIARYSSAQWIDSESLEESERGSGGFGSTGKS